MPSPFDTALALADATQLRIFGECVTFRDSTGDLADCDLKVIFSERDVPEPPNNIGISKGQYSTAWTLLSLFPVTNPEGYQVWLSVEEGYWIRAATADGGGAVTMKLHKVR